MHNMYEKNGHKNMNLHKCRNKNRICLSKRKNDKIDKKRKEIKENPKTVRKPKYNKEK